MASNAPRRSLRSNHELIRNSPTLSQSQPAAEGSSRQVKRRGRAVKKNIYKVHNENRGVVPIKFDDVYEKPVRSNLEIWETELGIIPRENIPLHYEDWVDVPEFERQSLYDIIKKEFGVDCNMDSKAREAADLSFSTAFRKHRYRLKEHFDKFETEEIGRRNPYSRVDAEDWQMMCDRWKTEKFQKMSARNKVNRKKLKCYIVLGQSPMPKFIIN